MNKKKLILLFLLLVGISESFGQNYSFKKKYSTQKNTMYFHWGYNRSVYTRSDINFYGPEYNFTLKDAVAHDRPSRVFSTYVNIKTISVPQFNIRLGWYYKERWDFSFGYDHMKYVMDDWQTLYIDGNIAGTTTSQLSGTYSADDGKIPIRPQDLHYENTNGLNYLSFQLNNTAPLYSTNNSKFMIQRRMGGGFGPVITQTDFNWDGTTYNSRLKLAGYGISLNAGVRFDFFKRFYFLSNWSTGFIHLPKNATIQYQEHYAKQKFIFGQWELVAGVLWYIRTKNGCGTCPDWH